MRIHNTYPIPIAQILTCHNLEDRRFTRTSLPDNIEVSESVLSLDSDFFLDSLVYVMTKEESLLWDVYRSFDNLEVLPSDLRRLVVLGVRKVKNRCDLFEIEHHPISPRKREIPKNKLSDESLRIGPLLYFERIAARYGILRKRRGDIFNLGIDDIWIVPGRNNTDHCLISSLFSFFFHHTILILTILVLIFFLLISRGKYRRKNSYDPRERIEREV